MTKLVSLVVRYLLQPLGHGNSRANQTELPQIGIISQVPVFRKVDNVIQRITLSGG